MLTERNLDLEEKVRELRETVGDLVREGWLAGWGAPCACVVIGGGGGRPRQILIQRQARLASPASCSYWPHLSWRRRLSQSVPHELPLLPTSREWSLVAGGAPALAYLQQCSLALAAQEFCPALSESS